MLKPAILVLKHLGNMVLRLLGLQPGAGEESLHSAEELKLLVSASQEAGLLQLAQQEVVERVFNMGGRPVGDIMTPRTEIDWVDADDSLKGILAAIRAYRHDQILINMRFRPWANQYPAAWYGNGLWVLDLRTHMTVPGAHQLPPLV